jgi:hypothetical protein
MRYAMRRIKPRNIYPALLVRTTAKETYLPFCVERITRIRTSFSNQMLNAESGIRLNTEKTAQGC